MLIKYIGTSTVRLIAGLRFDDGNQRTCERVDAELIGNLLTMPGVDFAVSDADPLAQLVGSDKAA